MKKLAKTIAALWIACALARDARAAITYVGQATNGSSNGGNVSLVLPASNQNDLIIVACGIGDSDNTDFTMSMVTSGYTNIADLFADDNFETNLGVWYKFQPATPDTGATCTGQGGTNAAVAAVALIFRGVDTTTPMDVTATTATNVNTMHPNPPSIDHLNPSGVVIVIAGASGHNLGGAGTYTFPTGYTTNSVRGGANDTNDITVGLGYRDSGVSDPEDPGTMTHSGTDATTMSWAAVTMALRPAAVVASCPRSLTTMGVGC